MSLTSQVLPLIWLDPRWVVVVINYERQCSRMENLYGA